MGAEYSFVSAINHDRVQSLAIYSKYGEAEMPMPRKSPVSTSPFKGAW